MEYLATFFTSYGALAYERYCLLQGISCKIQPVPRELSASCGIAVRFRSDNLPHIAEHEDMEGCYLIQDGKYIYQEIVRN